MISTSQGALAGRSRGQPKEIRDFTCTRSRFGECQIIERRKKDRVRKRIVAFLGRTVEEKGYHPIGRVRK